MAQRNGKRLPGTGPEREALRQERQFWTPDWVAEAMVSYILTDGNDTVFDPAVGAGAFFRAAKKVGKRLGLRPVLLGSELDPDALRQAVGHELSAGDLAGVKGQLRRLGSEVIGRPLDGRAGIHVYFLLRALQLLAEGGRLAFIMPADTCEGVFAPVLWNWITAKYRLEAVITFDPDASPFPGIDTNPVIFMISHAGPAESFQWARCTVAGGNELTRWVHSAFSSCPDQSLMTFSRSLLEGLTTGLSRPPREKATVGPTLMEYARVMRGIATGADEFFFLTDQQARDLRIPGEFLVSAVGRTLV